MVTVNTWCCLRLKTYGLVVGWVSLISTFGVMTSLAVGLGHTNCLAKRISDIVGQTFPHVKFDEVFQAITILGSIYLIFAIIGLIAAVMLIVGINKELHWLLLPWLTISGIGIILALIGNFVFLLNGVFLQYVLGSTILQLILIYISYGVYSLYEEFLPKSTVEPDPTDVESKK